MSAKITSQHEWVSKIERLLPSASDWKLRRPTDYKYVDTVGGKSDFIDGDAYNFANSAEHDDIIVRTVPALEAKAGTAAVEHLLGELTFRKTYGAFSELAAYDWMNQAGIDYTPQVGRTADEVVNPNGSTIDGRFRGTTKEIFFDIKAFGFVEHKLKLLKKRLENNADGHEILVQGLLSILIEAIQSLFEKPGYDALTTELEKNGIAPRGSLTFIRRPRRRVSVSCIEIDPMKLAQVAIMPYASEANSSAARLSCCSSWCIGGFHKETCTRIFVAIPTTSVSNSRGRLSIRSTPIRACGKECLRTIW